MLKKIIINAINGYQKYKRNTRDTSPCRFSPTCSQYSKEAIDKYGILKGVLLGVVRVLKCNPLFKGGIDPVK